MPTNTMEATLPSIEISKEVVIAAPLQIVFEALLEEAGPASQMPGGKPLPMVLEPWPGGRWYRDLGDRAGHFWGHVQVIKPPELLEICGPMFMSQPAINHLQYRLTADGAQTRLKLLHRAIGQIPRDFREGADGGWEYKIQHVRQIAERLANTRQK